MTHAYPLQWPENWKRTPSFRRTSHSQFKTTFDKARSDIQKELRLLDARSVVISSNIPLRLDGNPRAETARRKVEDPGVAVYFMLKGRQMVMARDAYENVHDNLRSIGLAIAHLRGMERHGGGNMMERAFEGFATIAAPGATKSWREILGIPPTGAVTLEIAEQQYRARAKRCHPDAGGSIDAMTELNAAINDARRALAS